MRDGPARDDGLLNPAPVSTGGSNGRDQQVPPPEYYPTPAYEALELDDPPPYARLPETLGAPRAAGIGENGPVGGQRAKKAAKLWHSCLSGAAKFAKGLPLEGSSGPKPRYNSTLNTLSNSKLAAASWSINGAGGQSRFDSAVVFFQGRDGALMVSEVNRVSQSWAVTNISTLLETQATPISLLNGTAIAALYAHKTSRHDEFVQVYYFNASNQLEYIEYTTDLTDTKRWRRHRFSADLELESSAPGGQLAAYFDSCASPICTESSIVVYQDRTNKLVVLASEYGQEDVWTRDTTFLHRLTSRIPDPVPGGTLVLASFSPYVNAKDVYNPTPRTGLRLFVQHDQMTEYVWDRTMGQQWKEGKSLAARDPGQPPQYPWAAAYSWDTGIKGTTGNHSEDVVVAMLFPNGTLWSSRFVDPNWVTGGSPVFNREASTTSSTPRR
ncbi:hypothetical protein B0T19DRAFT_468565 [Cercophora scortea]|uniref:Fucose-specific lectin n=1 Tax=Cercophora scortea TaxID=314031 RepID=A0AAE0I9Q7_9PEZI|nr:hypothetical protein B0T19DRAFT_468565 [Cercophora scortea]